MRRTRRYWCGALAALMALAAGCAEELGPEPMRTARVSGRIRVGDRPVGGGWVEFVPVDGTVGNLRTAPLAPDGTFEADRVAVGRVLIGLAHPATRLPGGRLFETYYSPIRRDIPGPLAPPLDIDLLGELARARGPSGGRPRPGS